MSAVSARARSQRIIVTPDRGVEVIDGGVIGPPGPPGHGLPTGGVSPQLLTKNSNADFDVSWVTKPVPTGITNAQLDVAPAFTIKGPRAGTGRPADLTVTEAQTKQSLNLAWNQISSIFENGWVDYASPYGPPRVRLLYLEQVTMRGLISGGAVGSAIGTMFVGYRPAYEVIVTTACAGGTCEIRIATSGVMTVAQATTTGANPTAWVSLSGITYTILA